MEITPELISLITRLIDEKMQAIYVGRSEFAELKELVGQISQNLSYLSEIQRRSQEEFVSFRKTTEENFNRVWESINQLAEAQRRTEESLESFKRETAENFKRVWESINQLIEAQRRTEERLNQLTIKVEQLAEAQRKTEERLNQITIRVEQLAEAQRKTEERLNQLAIRVEQLAEAQRRTEERLNELAEAQRRTEERLDQLAIKVEQLAEAQRKTEERLNQLAEAQRRTEERLIWLINEHERTREILAGISDTVGYGLEDKVMFFARKFAKHEYGVEAEIVDRRNVVYPDGRYDEVNIYIEGKKNGEKVYIIGECKSRPSKKEIEKLAKKMERLRNYLNADVYAFVVGYYFSPEVEAYLREEYPNIRAFKSFEFEMKYGEKV
ncbi:MAG: hypothetical protein ABDI07_07475 [Candidatus Kryptonium sp.]